VEKCNIFRKLRDFLPAPGYAHKLPQIKLDTDDAPRKHSETNRVNNALYNAQLQYQECVDTVDT